MYKVAYSSYTIQLVEPWIFPNLEVACDFINTFKDHMGGTFTLLDDNNDVVLAVTGTNIAC